MTDRQLISVLHHNMSRWNPEWFKRGESVQVIEKYRDTDGQWRKRVVAHENPTIRYAVTNEQFRGEHTLPELSYPAEKCDSYESPVKDIFLHAAQLTGQEGFYNETRGPGANSRRRAIHGHRWLHGTDVNIADHYYDRYIEAAGKNHCDTNPVTVSYADIEVDGIDVSGFPEEDDAPAPVNLISYFYGKTLYQFIGRFSVRPNAQIAEYEANREQERIILIAEMNRGVLAKSTKDEPALCTLDTPWPEIALKLGLIGNEPDPLWIKRQRCTDAVINFFDDEVSLITQFFHQVNEVDRPDVVAFWNMRFDIITLMNRLRKAGIEPESVITPRELQKWKYAQYDTDTFNSHPTEKSDTFTVNAFSVYIDQMLLYAQLRKQSGKKDSYSLDSILSEEIKENKVEYDGSISDLAYRDFRKFCIYAGGDVVPMQTLEKKTTDIALAYRLSMVTRTRIHHIMKKTTCLANLARVFYRDRGLILSNNRNRLRERVESEKFRGAFVASPLLMNYTGEIVGGKVSNRIFKYVADFDATSLYPSILRAFQIDAIGQIGRIIFEHKMNNYETVEKNSAEEIEAWASGDFVEIGRAWFGLPGVDEAMEFLETV